MKITKYPQSCLLIETKNKKVLIDPGKLKYEDRYLDAWKQADIVLLTHKHGDHVNSDALNSVSSPIYSTQEVQKTYPELKINIIKEGDVFDCGDVKIEVTKAIHGYNPNLKGGNEIFENVGYIIGDGDTRIYITSDTICFPNGYKVDIVALPVTAYGLTMSSYEASLLSKDLGAKLVLPIHMDNEMYPTDLEYMKKNFEKYDVNYKVLEIEESIIPEL